VLLRDGLRFVTHFLFLNAQISLYPFYPRLCASCKAALLYRSHWVLEKAIHLGEEPLGIIKHDEMPGRVRHGKMQRPQTLILFFERLLKLRPGHIHATGAELLVLAAPAAAGDTFP
jgi:hypothetical protein